MKTLTRAWHAGLPATNGMFLVANRGEHGPENAIIVKAVAAGPRTLLLDLNSGENIDVDKLGPDVFSYPLPKITERAV